MLKLKSIRQSSVMENPARKLWRWHQVLRKIICSHLQQRTMKSGCQTLETADNDQRHPNLSHIWKMATATTRRITGTNMPDLDNSERKRNKTTISCYYTPRKINTTNCSLRAHLYFGNSECVPALEARMRGRLSVGYL